MSTASLDDAAVAALRSERLDWRFKSMPHTAFGITVEEFLRQRPTLFGSGFAGPVLVLDEHALRHNLVTMADWCARLGLLLSPHGKTTMAPQLFQRQIEHGAWGITAANLGQMRVYRAFGVSRIVLANQFVDPTGMRWLADELDRDPGFSFCCWVDSVRGVRLMTEALGPRPTGGPIDVLIELGRQGARSGVRTFDEAVAVADAVAASPALRLVGVAGYEGAMAEDVTSPQLSIVDDYLRRLRDLVRLLADAGHFQGLDTVLVTCGGSAYFDQVAEALTGSWPVPVTGVLRSGSYVTHDDGHYRTLSPFGRPHRLAGAEQPLRPALRIWAQVTSRPEPGLALATMGRRDVSFDQDLPEPQLTRGADGRIRPLPDCRVTALADQHAFVALPADSDVQVGDWMAFGLSHPCTVFDKWSLIPVVDGETIVDLVRTFF